MKIRQLIPELLVENMARSLKFYNQVLGFKSEIVFPEDKPIFAQVGRDGVQIMLYDRSDFQKEIPKLKKIKMAGTVLLYFKAEKIESFYQEIRDKIKVVQLLHQTSYGSLEFSFEDCNGYLIAFSEMIKK
ncbi:hypothetical protein A2160_03695 [Candidatus Beckwithbacteria bacterium RBG_13_42_9]|uniref:VOC domain-containing protein n=1 Tax=Candidatus Beckwithbacteria bacterium RBG_13_42_9 TaxID=1797457 RepID=A0A1F5E8N0_9BACT|nr:MAG: hypothetical protein A2160_03695 [Candidatus Beckwithbacteria bacterium RBG_13_42_9]